VVSNDVHRSIVLKALEARPLSRAELLSACGILDSAVGAALYALQADRLVTIEDWGPPRTYGLVHG